MKPEILYATPASELSDYRTRLTALEAENTRLKAKLAQAKAIFEVAFHDAFLEAPTADEFDAVVAQIGGAK